MRRVTVRPKSSKAKNRLANMMSNNPICIVEQDDGHGMLFLASENGKYFFWVNTSNDWDESWHQETEWEVIGSVV